MSVTSILKLEVCLHFKEEAGMGNKTVIELFGRNFHGDFQIRPFISVHLEVVVHVGISNLYQCLLLGLRHGNFSEAKALELIL